VLIPPDISNKHIVRRPTVASIKCNCAYHSLAPFPAFVDPKTQTTAASELAGSGAGAASALIAEHQTNYLMRTTIPTLLHCNYASITPPIMTNLQHHLESLSATKRAISNGP